MHLEIWSDIACPWCYVGKRNLEAALAEYEHADDVTVEWKSFELDPHAPPEREQDAATHLAEKYGTTPERARAMNAQMTQVAAGAGLEFRLDTLRLGTTFDGHRLVHLAAEHGLQDAMKERLFRAYLTEGELVSDHAMLERVAAEVGLPLDEVRDALGSARFTDEVRADELEAQQLGVTGVPFFVVDRRIAASGAQPPEVLLELLRRARPEPALDVVTGGEACGPDGC